MTNEVRLIDANALIKEMKKCNIADFIAVQSVLDIIDNVPTVRTDNYAMGYQDGVRKVLSELSERGCEMGNIFGDYKPVLVAITSEENKND